MKLIPNIPLDTHAIARLINDRDDMRLVWPKAGWPFDHDQWRRALDPAMGHHPFLIHQQYKLIGHAALRTTSERSIYTVNYLYLQPQVRSQGIGQVLLTHLEKYAAERLQAQSLKLVVRTFNPRALACYQKNGFKVERQVGSLLHMFKDIC